MQKTEGLLGNTVSKPSDEGAPVAPIVLGDVVEWIGEDVIGPNPHDPFIRRGERRRVVGAGNGWCWLTTRDHNGLFGACRVENVQRVDSLSATNGSGDEASGSANHNVPYDQSEHSCSSCASFQSRADVLDRGNENAKR